MLECWLLNSDAIGTKYFINVLKWKYKVLCVKCKVQAQVPEI